MRWKVLGRCLNDYINLLGMRNNFWKIISQMEIFYRKFYSMYWIMSCTKPSCKDKVYFESEKCDPWNPEKCNLILPFEVICLVIYRQWIASIVLWIIVVLVMSTLTDIALIDVTTHKSNRLAWNFGIAFIA